MSSSGSDSGDTFEVQRIRRLVELMDEFDLGEVDLRQGDQRIRLRRSGDMVPEVVQSAPPPASAPTTQQFSVAGATAAVQSPIEDNPSIAEIKSPMIGTFYKAANPESPPYVQVGDHVGPDTTVCMIEAMKVFNELPAEVSGKIVSVLVENGESVEFGQPLFKVDTSS